VIKCSYLEIPEKITTIFMTTFLNLGNICYYVTFEVFTVVTMKNGVFWDT
jgi:hypothetical protein